MRQYYIAGTLSKDKYLGCPPLSLFGTILEVDQRRTSTNGAENINLMTMHKALHPRDDGGRLYVSRKEGGRGIASVEVSVDLSI